MYCSVKYDPSKSFNKDNIIFTFSEKSGGFPLGDPNDQKFGMLFYLDSNWNLAYKPISRRDFLSTTDYEDEFFLTWYALWKRNI